MSCKVRFTCFLGRRIGNSRRSILRRRVMTAHLHGGQVVKDRHDGQCTRRMGKASKSEVQADGRCTATEGCVGSETLKSGQGSGD